MTPSRDDLPDRGADRRANHLRADDLRAGERGGPAGTGERHARRGRARRRPQERGRGRGPTRPLGPLALPMPSPTARVESEDDGSLRIRDRLSAEGLGTFLVRSGELIREGLLEPPAWFGASLGDGTSVRFDRGEGGDAASRLADGMEHMGRSILDGRVDPRSVAFSLDCGCGVLVERR
ncbi:MAG: hypothetical protein KF878_24160 [Planctomycetes bacterium]|nr:hypothetical protein [Planctomycetota bacterium]